MEKIIYASIYTMDRENPFVEAVGIEDGKIVYAGSRDGLESAGLSGNEEILDFTGKAVFPGFMDTHVHAVPSGVLMGGANLADVKNIAEAIEKMKPFAETVPEGEWIFATAFQDKNIEEKRFLRKSDLDKVSDKHPIVVFHNDLHPFAFNSMGIELLKIDPAMDGVETDENGEPTGFVGDPAFMTVSEQMISLFTDEDVLKGYGNIDEYAVSNGITTVFTKDYYPTIKLFWDNRDKFKTEIKPMLRTQGCDDMESLQALLADEELRDITSVCVFADGAFDSYSGSVVEPYEGYPESFGILMQSNDVMYDYLMKAHKAGLQVSCHAIGDNAIDQVLNVYERMLRDYPRDDHRHRIEHFEMPKKAAIKKAARLGCALGMQPLLIEVCEGMDMEGYRPFVGDRVVRCSPYRSVLDEGLMVGGGSDFSVTAMDPIRSVMICMQNPVESERISMYEGFELFTIGAARLGFLEDRKGMIKPGYDADIAVLNRNPFAGTAEELEDTKVIYTICRGQTAYEL